MLPWGSQGPPNSRSASGGGRGGRPGGGKRPQRTNSVSKKSANKKLQTSKGASAKITSFFSKAGDTPVLTPADDIVDTPPVPPTFDPTHGPFGQLSYWPSSRQENPFTVGGTEENPGLSSESHARDDELVAVDQKVSGNEGFVTPMAAIHAARIAPLIPLDGGAQPSAGLGGGIEEDDDETAPCLEELDFPEDEYDPRDDPDADDYHDPEDMGEDTSGGDVSAGVGITSSEGVSASTGIISGVVSPSGGERRSVGSTSSGSVSANLDPFRDDIFHRALREIIEVLQAKLSSMPLDDFKKDLPIVWSFYGILQRTSCDNLLKRLLPTILPEVRVLFEKEEWTLKDLHALKTVHSKDTRMGVYCDLVTGRFSGQDNAECDVYTGYSSAVGKRCYIGHAACIRKRDKSNSHYKRASSPSATGNFFKLLAVFSPGQDTMAAQLLEGLFMILLDTWKADGPPCRFCPQATFDLAKDVRPDWLFSPGWNGLNMVWSLKQGVCGTGLRGESTCCNPACSHRVARRADIVRRRKQGTLGRFDVAVKRRFLADPLDALAGFLCESCYRQRRDRYKLPDAKWIYNRNVEGTFAADNKAGIERSCDHCGDVQNPNARDMHHVRDADLFMCAVCAQHWYDFGKLRDLGTKIRQEERDAARNADARCHNGDCPMTEFLCIKKYGRPLHWTNGGGFRCELCYAYTCRNPGKEHPDPLSNFSSEELDRLQQMPARTCFTCEGKEGELGVSKFWLKDGNGEDICLACSKYLLRYKKRRTPQIQRLSEAKAQVEKDRLDSIEVFCGVCNRKESAVAKKFTMDEELCLPLCRKCADAARKKAKKAAKADDAANAGENST
ncbi:uncharacterized protein PFLUO_LOCUS7640 [Penicillium psychrofluorescens]|uniref:uncharacterized protein n=1 Tax=Penicillium psychrofluorescens TaxID=3158075 RepID=UPI003CCE1898